MYKGYLIDLDGTAYRGSEVIQETIDFVTRLKEKNIAFMFVTNNSSVTEQDVVFKLNNMGYEIDDSNVITTSRSTASYISDNISSPLVYTIGSHGLISALNDANIPLVEDYKQANTVVVGLDRQVDYDKFSYACLAIRNGATFISTNPDVAIPSEIGFLPGNGALTKLIEHSTGQDAIFIGKPEKYIMQAALKKMKLKVEDVCMIGDNYYTDISAGINMGMDTIFVNTGLTTLEDIKKMAILPTHCCETLLDFIDNI